MVLKTKYLQYNNKTLDGILSYMTNETGYQNLNEHGIVKVTASSKSESIPNIFKDGYTFYYSANESGSWLMFDFLKNKISITSYTIRHLLHDVSREWVLLGSDDKKRWDTIDHKTYDDDFSYSYDRTDNFYYEAQLPMVRRYIKLMQVKERLAGDNYMSVHRIEFFGIFYHSRDIIRMSCFVKNARINRLILYLVLLLIY